MNSYNSGYATYYFECSREEFINTFNRNDFSHLLSRNDGPSIVYSYGDTMWYLNGRRHRRNGPAEENRAYRAWVLYGYLHREDGPAIEFKDDNTKEWFIWNIEVSEEEYQEYMTLKREDPIAHKLAYSDRYDLTYESYD